MGRAGVWGEMLLWTKYVEVSLTGLQGCGRSGRVVGPRSVAWFTLGALTLGWLLPPWGVAFPGWGGD